MNFSFGNSALLWGTLLFTVPLIIHLLNRRRFRVIRWAAQEFLLQAYQRTRRRLTLESLLLLLLRCLLIALLAFAMAQPFVPSSSLLSRFSSAQKNLVLVIDTSYSMGRVTRGGDSVMERAKAQAKELLDGLSEERGDEVTVVALADTPRAVQSTTSSMTRAKEAIDRLSPDWRGADLVRTLDYLVENVLGGSHKDVYVFTDLQRETFEPGVRSTASDELGDAAASPASAWRVAAEHDCRFVIVDVGDDDAPVNLTIEGLESVPHNVVAGEVVRLSATVRNHTAVEMKSVTGTFVIDGEREKGKKVRFDVPSGGVQTVECSTKFDDDGVLRRTHTVLFEIDEDDLAADNARVLAFPVNQSVRVLLVDGSYDAEPDLRETTVLADMLNPIDDPETGGSVFRPRVVDAQRFNHGAETLKDYDLIVLANVAGIDVKVADELRDAVFAGRGLLIFLGDMVDARSYNERLHFADGSGLLPARLLDVRGDLLANSDRFFRMKVLDFYHPIVRLFADPNLQPNLLGVPIRRFFRTEISPKDSATSVVVALDDDPAHPGALILDKPAGRGRVVLFTTSADSAWADFAAHNNVITYLPLVQETASYLTLTDASIYNLSVGDPLRRTTRSIPSEVHVTRPDNVRDAITDVPREMEFGEFVLPAFRNTDEPGLYALELAYPLAGAGEDAGRQEVEHFAVNVDVRESDLTRIEADAFPVLYPGLDVPIIHEIDVQPLKEASSREGELWRALLWGVVLLTAAEMLLAWWFGRGNRGGAA